MLTIQEISARPRLQRSLGIIGALIFLLSSTLTYAAGSQITATLNREEVSIKQTVSVTVVAEVEGVSSQARIIEPAWSEQGWQVLGRSQMTQMQFVNGARSLEVTYTYQLRPTRLGELQLGPFTGGGTASGLSSNVLKVKVTEKAPPRSQSEQSRDHLYAQIKWMVDKKEVWLGERIDASLVVYVLNKLRLTDLTVPDIDLQGFWAEEAEPPRRSPLISIGGNTYSQKVIKRDLLTPLKAGELTLPSFDVNLVVGTHSFFTETQEIPQTVPTLPITVKPLPPNAPKGFRGPTVGEVEIVAALDRTKIREGDGIQLNIRTSTSGMLANTPAIELPYIDGIKIFPPTERTNTQNLGGRERSVRTQTWLIKPERPGQFKIPSISLPYFDPRRGVYDFAKTRDLSFSVKPNPNGQSVTQETGSMGNKDPLSKSSTEGTQSRLTLAKTATPHAAERLGVQLSSIMTEELSVSERGLPEWLWWLIGLLGPLALTISELRAQLDRFHQSNAAGRAQGKAGKLALRTLESLQDYPLNYSELDEAICVYLESRFQQSFRGLTRDQACQRLSDEGLSSELVEGYRGLVDAADFARFAPGASHDQGAQVKKIAKAWVTLVEDQLSSGLSTSRSAEKAKLSGAGIIFTLVLSFGGLLTYSSQVKAAPPSARETEQVQQEKERNGDHFFWSGDYKEASRIYRSQVEANPQQPMIWYNLGTALAHEGSFGESAYALQRAHSLSPDHETINAQLESVNQAIIEDGVRHPGKRRLVLPDELTSSGGVFALVTLHLTRATALLSFSLACLVLLGLRRQQRSQEPLNARQLKRAASARAVVVILSTTSLISAGLWWAKGEHDKVDRGVVIAHRAPLHRGPGDQYEVEVNIAGGVKVELQGERENWQRIKLSDGREGWLKTQELRSLPKQ